MKIIKNTFTLSLIVAFFALPLFAKEPTNIMIGFGIGAGQSKLSMKHSQIINDPIQTPTAGSTALRWQPQQNRELSSWALAWEFLAGYKHFINDWVGFRYYANVGIQHYKPISFQSKEQKIGFVDYTLNADLLIDFWESEFFAIGMFGGMGFGGTSFDRKAISQYMAIYHAQTGIAVGLANVTKHFFNVNANVGLRMTFFQKYRRTSARVCDKFINGKRACRVPIFYIGHSIEFNAKFPLMDYRATPLPDIIVTGTGGNAGVVSRPAYTVSNPYRLMIRYVVDF